MAAQRPVVNKLNVEQEVVSLRRMVRIQGLVMLAGLAVIGVLGAKRNTPPDRVVAREIVLENPAGQIVGDWLAQDNGSTLSLLNGKRSILVALASVQTASTIFVNDPSGKMAAGMSASPIHAGFDIERNDHTLWNLWDRSETPTASESFYSESGNTVYQLPPAK
jgi:hypothetical protein